MSKNSNISTFRFITEILNIKNNRDDLEQVLNSTDINWDQVVQIASKHLVLTTFYCRLKDDHLISYLPEELANYLEQLTSINRQRNLKLLEEAEELDKILTKNHINYVFIKGMAILMGGYYNDLGARMIGDFDILVDEKDIDRTFSILKNKGYDTIIKFAYERSGFRHLPRQINENKLAAIELHRHVLNSKTNHLISVNAIFENKKRVKNGFIPSNAHQNLINILTSQINDNNYFYNTVNLKNAYDSLVLDLKTSLDGDFKIKNLKYVKHYLALIRVWFRQYKSIRTSKINLMRSKMYIIKIKHEKLRTVSRTIKFLIDTFINRLKLLFYNKSYRTHIIKTKILKKT